MKKFITSILIASGVIYLTMSVVWIRSHGWNRPYISWDIRELASYLAEHDLSPRGCLDLVWFEIGLSQTEARAECVYNYAKLTKDPSACELLMPSSYGLSCVGAARSMPQPCYLKPDLSVGGNGIKASLGECVTGPNLIKNNACCVISRVSSIIGYDDCSSIKDSPDLSDQCHHELAFKKRDPSLCQPILNSNTRSACEVQAKALQKNPSICSGCTPPIESIDELK